MKNIALAIFALAFVAFVTASGSLVAMNHPSNADRLAMSADPAER
jgi:hypothetical protein